MPLTETPEIGLSGEVTSDPCELLKLTACLVEAEMVTNLAPRARQ